MKNRSQIFGTCAALSANIIFGFSFIFSKLALSAAHPLIILAVRFTAAFAVMNLLLITGKFKISLKGKPKVKLIAMSAAQPLLYFLFELYGLSKVSSALSGVIIALVPVAAMLLSAAFLKERPTAAQIICTVISLAGISAVSIISNDGSKNYIAGIILLSAAVICAAFFNILSRSESETYSPFERTYFMFLIGSIGFIAIAAAALKNRFLPELVSAFKSPDFITAIIYLAVISSVAAFLLYNYSTSKISVIQASSFSNIITVVTVIAGVTLLEEHFSVAEYLLCAVIIAGVWGVNVFTRQKKDITE